MATAGPNSPSAASGTNWVNPGNVYTQNSVYASYSIAGGGGASFNLAAQGFGFAIPDGSTLNGYTVVIWRYGEVASLIRDSLVRLLNGSGTGTGNDKSSASWWPTSNASATYGSSSDVWGTSFTTTDTNSSSFGVQLSVQNTDSVTRTAYVDYVSITIDYTAPSGQPMQARARAVPYVRKTRVGW